MAKRLRRLAALLSAAILAVVSFPAGVGAYNLEAYYDSKPKTVENFSEVKQNFETVDLSAYATTSLGDEVAGDGIGGWSDQGSVNDFSTFNLKGINNLSGIPFYITNPITNGGKSVIMLSGRDDKRLPLSVEIPIGKKAGGVYILHNAVWGDRNNVCGNYVYVYDDGTEYAVEQIVGQQIPGWWSVHYTDYCIPGWTGSNNTTIISNSIYACINPFPEKTISKIRLESNNYCYMAIFGLTLTDIAPVLPKIEQEDIGNPDTTDWFTYVPCYDADAFEGTALDMSWLNDDFSALGHGALLTDGEDFVYEDGTKTKFWGVNYQLIAYPSHEESDYEAKRIAQSGFNCVRVSSPTLSDGNATVFAIDRTTSRLIGFNDERMDRFCYFLYALKKEGISIMLQLPDLSTSVRSVDNNTQDINLIEVGVGQYDPDLIKLNNEAARMYLDYVNPYTGQRIADDESVQFMYLYNEATIFMINKYRSPYYYNVLKEYFNEWLRKKYSTRSEMASAWENSNPKYDKLRDDENQFDGTVDINPPETYYKTSPARVNDCMEFISDLTEEKYSERFDYLRSLGFKGRLIGSTRYGDRSSSAFYSNLMSTDVGDTHAYNNPINGAVLWSGNSIKIPSSDLENGGDSYMKRLNSHKPYNRAYTITEWNATIPNPYACEDYLMIPAFASMQNWNPFLFTWNEGTSLDTFKNTVEVPKLIRNYRSFTLNESPAMLYSLPVMAMVFRRGDIKEADKAFYYSRLSRDETLSNDTKKDVQDFTYALAGKTGVAYDDVGYDESINSNDVLKLKSIGDKTGIYTSITGELQTDLNKKIFKVNTGRTQAATGFLGNNTIDTSDASFDIDTKFATVFLSSLSYDSLKDCDSMLLTAVSRHKNWEQKMNEQGTKFLTNAEGPIIIEQITGNITLKSYDTFKVYALGSDGSRQSEVKTEKTKEGYTKIILERDNKTVNYEIVRTAKSARKYTGSVDFLENTDLGNIVDDLGKYEDKRNKIERVLLQNFMKYTDERCFSPDLTVTRGQFADIIVKSNGLSGASESNFNDVPLTHEYQESINTLKTLGVISGDSNGNFNPDMPITVEDMAVIVDRAINISKKYRNKNLSVNISQYTDSGMISDYALSSIKRLLSEDILETENNMLNPKGYLTRADAATVVYNILWK